MRPSSAPPPSDLINQVETTSAGQHGWLSQSYSCRLVTPMYGGGVKPGEVDREMPIRASAIRGQLRFWWRLVCAQNLSAAEMFRREVDIWGGIGNEKPAASKVKVHISKLEQPRFEPAHNYPPNPQKPGQMKSWPEVSQWASAYALFSAQGKLKVGNREFENKPKELAREGLAFVLNFQISEQLTATEQEEVKDTLRWWASFGGIGARTRRGLGAVLIESLEPVSAEEVRQLGGALECLQASKDALAAWRKAIDRLRNFRQGEHVGRNKKAADSQSPAGRSLWPEADALRTLSGESSARHSVRIVDADAFPRAVFGLPLVFHFNNPKNDNSKEPQDHILEPSDISREQKQDRMASPLILRPYWTGREWLPAALLLPGWSAALTVDLKFKGKHYIPQRWPDDENKRRELTNKIRPMQDRGTNPLSAFMAFFAENK